MKTIQAPLLLPALLLASTFATACSSGGGGDGETVGSQAEFELDAISVPEGSVWPVNLPIEFTFTRPVDFTTVSPNTINIRAEDGSPATGVFQLKRVDDDGDGVKETEVPEVVVFQPTCPTRDDLSDAGLQLPSRRYTITLVGSSSNAQDTVRSTTGQVLRGTQRRSFVTPASTDQATAFQDIRPNEPPRPLFRPQGSSLESSVSFFQVVDSESGQEERVFFEGSGVGDPDFRAPLNLFSDATSRIVAMLVFDQPVSPSDSNLSQDFLRIEFLFDDTGEDEIWRPLDTRVQLLRNCTEAGALVSLEPVGILPVASEIRVAMRPGFSDIAGEQVDSGEELFFARAPTQTVMFTSLSPDDEEGDEIFEDFDFGGDDPLSREDQDALFDTPPAEWGGESGNLTAAFDFAGTGGPDGDFDWVIPSGTDAVLDTVSDQIIGGEGGLPETTVNVVNGFVDVRDFVIEEGATLRIQGGAPLCINASRNVIIRGTLDASGFDAPNVQSIDTGNQPEPGGSGVAGGGRGGTASQVTNSSTPKGGDGFGPFGRAGTGGEGGETAFTGQGTTNVNRRRPGGGGGGRFAKGTMDPTFGPDDQAIHINGVSPFAEVFGLIAEDGNGGAGAPCCMPDNIPNATGAISRSEPPMGGSAGFGPFIDGDDDNDFFGIRVEEDPLSEELVFTRGELLRPLAGFGGGAGGDAVPFNTFPAPNWTLASDEKGGGGGGGGGQVQIKALGRIVFGELGQILCQGGRGGSGENTTFFNHVGGGGGGGSGGHVMLETATGIDFTDTIGGVGPQMMPLGTSPFLKNEENDFDPYQGGRMRILANGGDGATTGDSVPPEDEPTVPRGLGYGGDGGPGVIQLQVPDPTQEPQADANAEIVVPITALAFQDVLRSIMAPAGIPLLPSFGPRSRARSEWIPLGAADQSASGKVRFYFDGTDSTGRIETEDGRVPELDPLLGTESITGNPDVSVTGMNTLSIQGPSLDPLRNDPPPLSNDVYLRTPALLQDFILRLTVAGNPGAVREYDVTAASYDDDAVRLDVSAEVEDLATTIQEFVSLNEDAGDTVEYTLIPRFFRVVTDGNEDVLPDGSLVRITFQGTGESAFGGPDEDDILVDFTGDVSDLNAQPAGAIQFVRFEVEFDLGADGSELTVDTKPVSIDFLRIPFRF